MLFSEIEGGPKVKGLLHRQTTPSEERTIMVVLSSDGVLWFVAQVLDYAQLASLCWLMYLLHGGEATRRYDHLTLGVVLACQGAMVVLAIYARERFYFWFFGDRIAEHKRKGQLAPRTYFYVFQTAALSMSSFFAMERTGIVFYEPYSFSFPFLGENFGLFYLILILRDVFFLWPLHGLMHTRRWYFLHKTHHEATHDAQSLHAFHIDAFDLVIENVGAPFLLLIAQYFLGFRVGFHWMVGVLLTCHDAALHSVNPYSVMYFNPLLDRFLKPNVHHQLHHAINKGYLLFVPYHHLLGKGKQIDVVEYNRVFRTSFTF